jgi:adenylosuccinate lyase
MATDDTARQIGAKLAAARKRVPEIKAAIQTRLARAKAEEGRRDLARLDKDLEEGGKLVAALVKELSASPTPSPSRRPILSRPTLAPSNRPRAPSSSPKT